MSDKPYGCSHCSNEYSATEVRKMPTKTCPVCCFGHVRVIRPNELPANRRRK